MENRVRLQHFVPQVYLKYFSDRINDKYYIWCFNKKTEKIFKTNIDNIALQEEFYEGIAEDQILEREFRSIESQYDKAIEKIIRFKDLNKLDQPEKDIISKFVSYQMIRTPEMREELRDLGKQIYNKFKDQASKEFKTQVENFLEENYRSSDLLETNERVKQSIRNRYADFDVKVELFRHNAFKDVPMDKNNI